MKKGMLIAVAVVVVAVASAAATGAQNKAERLERGRYLVSIAGAVTIATRPSPTR